MTYFLSHIYLIIIFLFFHASVVTPTHFQNDKDSIEIYLRDAKNSEFDIEMRKEFLKKAYRLTLKEDIDSIKKKSGKKENNS